MAPVTVAAIKVKPQISVNLLAQNLILVKSGAPSGGGVISPPLLAAAVDSAKRSEPYVAFTSKHRTILTRSLAMPTNPSPKEA
jgi:hypothetical protein